jgi:hypothetical protein
LYFWENGGFESRTILYKFVLNIKNIIKMESLKIPYYIAEQTINDASFSTPFLEDIKHGHRDNFYTFILVKIRENPTIIIQNT